MGEFTEKFHYPSWLELSDLASPGPHDCNNLTMTCNDLTILIMGTGHRSLVGQEKGKIEGPGASLSWATWSPPNSLPPCNEC